MASLFDKPIKFPLDPKDRFAIKTPNGNILNAEVGSIMNQLFNLNALGKSCLTYPSTTATDCETGETYILPLQLVEVLLMHEKKLCELITAVTYIQNNCCNGGNEDIVFDLYDEFLGLPTEWTVTESSGGNNMSLDSLVNPYSGIKSISIKETRKEQLNRITFTSDIMRPVLNIKNLEFMFSRGQFSPDMQMKVEFYKASSVVGWLSIFEGSYGFSNLTVGYMKITLPIPENIFTDSQFDEIVIIVETTDATKTVSNTNIDKVTLSYKNTNVAPIIYASSDQIIQLPIDTVNLSSYTEDEGGLLVHLWEKVVGGNAVIADATKPTAVFTGLVAGNYVFKVTVTDSFGLSSSDTVFVNVIP